MSPLSRRRSHGGPDSDRRHSRTALPDGLEAFITVVEAVGEVESPRQASRRFGQGSGRPPKGRDFTLAAITPDVTGLLTALNLVQNSPAVLIRCIPPQAKLGVGTRMLLVSFEQE